jgi:HSP20 family molecular chaperone IbpA
MPLRHRFDLRSGNRSSTGILGGGIVALSSIPPNTAFKTTRPTKRLGKIYTKPTSIKFDGKQSVSNNVELDVFKNGNELTVIGDFSGLEQDDLIISLSQNNLSIVSKPTAGKQYSAFLNFEPNFRTTQKNTIMRNGVMTIQLEQVSFEEVPTELKTIFEECRKKFPEIESVEIALIKNHRSPPSLSGAKGQVQGKDAVMLFVPEMLWGKWNSLKPIIYHELAHFVNLENPDEIFYQRADEQSIKLWNLLKEHEAVQCVVVGNENGEE